MSTETVAKQLYICTSCGFIYDPDEGDPDGGIPPGTAFDDIPDDWFCPVCGAPRPTSSPTTSSYSSSARSRERSWLALTRK